MKKRRMFLCILLAVLLTGCQCKHEWIEADCVTAKTCSACGEIEGEPLGHDWQDATCETPKQCSRCQATEGEALSHSWLEADCTQPKRCEHCESAEGEPLGHSYDKWMVVQGMMERTCWKCKDRQVEEIDRKILGEEMVTGKWTGEYFSDGERYLKMPDSDFISLEEDGQFLACLSGNTYMGTWGFHEYVNKGAHTPVYVFELDAGDGYIYVFAFDEIGLNSVQIIVDDIICSYSRKE